MFPEIIFTYSHIFGHMHYAGPVCLFRPKCALNICI